MSGKIAGRLAMFLLGWTLSAVAADERTLPTEKDFFGEMPIVLSVSRLPQTLDETPGAVTIIDRDTIRLSGARDVPDLMRLVPGFQVSNSFESGSPLAVYHGGFGDFANRIQVLIDGRSVYSAFFVGSAGLQSIALDDIERIEVLRGSNSAAYGARAFLGVINIITRDPGETHGVRVSKTAGERGVSDSLVQVGWGSDTANFRLSGSRRGDDGLTSIYGYDHFTNVHYIGDIDQMNGPYGKNHIGVFNFRADLRPGISDTLELRVGTSDQYSGTGNNFGPGNPQRERRIASAYVQADWRRNLSEDADFLATYSHTDEAYTDNFVYAPTPQLIIDSGGNASNDALLLQHSFRLGKDLRIVWGGELRREAVRSTPLYNSPLLTTDFTRLFGNLEWRLATTLLLNAGGMLERSSLTGSNFAPRLMLNWHAAPDHTLRIGVSQAYRPPSMFEKEADVRFVVNNILLGEGYVARGNVVPEKIRAHEIGYLGEIPALRLSADVRIFKEDIRNFIRVLNYLDTQPSKPQVAKDFVNADNFSIQGAECQVKFRPWRDTQVIFNRANIRIDSLDLGTSTSAPKHASTLALFQKLPGGVDLSVIHHVAGAMSWQRAGNLLQAMDRTDVRLAMPFRIGATEGEIAAVVQNLGSPYNDFNNTFYFWRRAHATLTLKF
ncbi:MAG: TonB-dependent receptor [Proteobacteria bacterium]|nr:TonB-dependent receptor [Pseudomonadota bacterium]